VTATTFLNRPVWLVTRYDDVLLVLKDERFPKDWTAKMPWVFRTRSVLHFLSLVLAVALCRSFSWPQSQASTV